MIKNTVLTLFLSSFLTFGMASPTSPSPETLLIKSLKSDLDFNHQIGRAGSNGWQADYKKDKPGYILSSLRDPLLLQVGLHRFTFNLRRGHYPAKGLLHDSYGLFRLEIWDLTLNEKVSERELQIADLPQPNHYRDRWIEFSTVGREGHSFEPRVYWPGLSNGEVGQIDIIRYPEPSSIELEQKANRLGALLQKDFLENGFVVSRKESKEPDETGDATTYTGWYAASLAWKFRVTHDDLTKGELENALEALHVAIKGTYDRPLLTRFVDESGEPFPKSASKDSYVAFFFAMAAADPVITNPALKKQMAQDVSRIVGRFIKEGLSFREGDTEILTLAPYFSERVVRSGIHDLVNDRAELQRFLKILKTANSLVGFGDLWPGSKEVIRALKKRDEEKIFQLVVPTANGVLTLAARLREILREQYREDLFLRKTDNLEYPGKKLEAQLTAALARFPFQKNGKRINQISDVKVLGSNALISLAMIRTTAAVSDKSKLLDFYRQNLFSGEALLKSALDWDSFDENIIRLTAGNPAADQERRGYLSVLSLYSLLQLENDPIVRKKYTALMDRWWADYRHDDNPMAAAMIDAIHHRKENGGFITRALGLYPEERKGMGRELWRLRGKEIGDLWGGGANDRYSAEPLPVSLRPKDSFLWQRNTRRLYGDELKDYPPTDFLFLYWFSRYHELIPAPEEFPTAKKN